MGLAFCGDTASSILRKSFFYVVVSMFFATFMIITDFTKGGYIYPEYEALYDAILEALNLLMAFFVFAIIVRARDINVQMYEAMDQHKKFMDNLYGLGGIIARDISKIEEFEFRRQIAKWLTAGFSLWIYWTNLEVPQDERVEMAEKLVKQRLLTQDEFDTLYGLTGGRLAKCHRIAYQWAAKLSYDTLCATKASGFAWDCVNECQCIVTLLDGTTANRNASFSFSYQQLVESFVVIINFVSALIMAYHITALAAAGGYSRAALMAWGKYAPILTFLLNIIFFTALYEVAREAIDPLGNDAGDITGNSSYVIDALKHDLFSMFRTRDLENANLGELLFDPNSHATETGLEMLAANAPPVTGT